MDLYFVNHRTLERTELNGIPQEREVDDIQIIDEMF